MSSHFILRCHTAGLTAMLSITEGCLVEVQMADPFHVLQFALAGMTPVELRLKRIHESHQYHG